MSDHMRALRRAISDPGATTKRGDNYNEHIVDWQIRALLAQPDALLAALVDAGVLAEDEKHVVHEVPFRRIRHTRLVTAWQVTQ